MKKNFILNILLLLLAMSLTRAAQASFLDFEKAHGQFGGGYGSGSLINPDNSTAYYTIYGLQGVGRVPIIGDMTQGFELDLMGTMKFYNLSNNTVINGENEAGYFLGPGAGLHFRVSSFVFGVSEEYLLARHYATGRISTVLNYAMTATSAFGGIQMPLSWIGLKSFSLTVLASYTQGIAPQSQTALTKDCAYQDQMYWLMFTYTAGRP